MSLIHSEAQQAVVHEAPGIMRCIIADGETDGLKLLQTSGVNLQVGRNKFQHHQNFLLRGRFLDVDLDEYSQRSN